ncbi:MAG: ABC transporter ATP-binding protein [Clostridiales bacterium]|jgi:ABC-2 type transport system ATP-binding protein|nr:ABC transporter ATP-binding protein [Clostridiales bacterium]
MLKCENVYKRYGSVVALNNVSIEFRPGEIVGLLGENGAGKTTLMKSILSYIRLDKGRVTLDGEKIGPHNIERIAFATSEHSFFGGLNAKEHKAFYQMQFPRFNEKRFDSLLEFFELSEKIKIKNFSTGQKNQFEVILALSQGADYILMDEPFAGNDIFNREDFYKVLLGILGENECLILSTHLIEEIKNFISRAVLLHKGQLIGDVTTLELDENNTDLMEYMRRQYSYKADRVVETLMKNEK